MRVGELGVHAELSMLQSPQSRMHNLTRDAPDEEAKGQLVDFDWLFSAARRQAWLIVLGIVVGVVLGAAYILAAAPLYTASVDVLIDKGRSKMINQYELSGPTDALQDEAEILSQVELLKSEQLARAVVSAQKLTDDAKFMEGSPSLSGDVVGSAKKLVGSAVAWISSFLVDSHDIINVDEVDERENEAADILHDGLLVDRVGRTYVLTIGFTAATPDLAARISQAYGDAYLDDQLQSKYEATRRASAWLQDRIAELKQQSFDADLKVQQFRTENKLISAGGQLVSEQQLTEINTQLVAAQASTAESKARLDQIESLISSGRTDAVVNQALASTTINNLRERYLDASRLKTEIEAKLGPKHVQVVRLEEQMAELDRLIFEELRRIAESYKSDYNVALSRQKSLEDSMAKILGVNANANTTQVRLRELERESATFKLLYDTFLQRYQETVQQESFPISNARVITPAALPKSPSFPRKPTVLALFLALGALASTGLAAFREYRDRFVRTGDQVRSEAKVEFLGYTPIVLPKASKGQSAPVASAAPATREPGAKLWLPDSMSVYVRSHPMSAFAETLRNVKVATDMALPENQGKVIGVVSCLPSEGKTTIAANLGVLFAMQGARVVLVDGDIRNPGLTRSLHVTPSSGLIEAIIEPAQTALPMLYDGSGLLALLPTVMKRRVSNTSALLASPRMGKLLSHFRAQCDYTIVDLPPIGPVVDAKAFAHRVDAFVFVVEWGRTSRQLLRSVMLNNPVFYDKCLGVILNKSDDSKMKLYETFGSPDYYASRYRSYYRD